MAGSGLLSLFRWGSVPGSPEEVRAFSQRRVVVYLGFMAALWGAGWAASTLLTLVTVPEHALAGMNLVRLGFHFSGVVVMAACWALARRKPLGHGALNALDLGTTVLQGALTGVMVVTALPLIRFRPDILLVLALTYSLVARAAVVPSSPSRTILVGVLAFLPLCSGVWLVYSAAFARGVAAAGYYPDDNSTPALYLVWSVVFSALSVGVSTFVSFVIYGLQRQVQDACQLGQYTLESRLGEGGMGVVYRGRHALLRRPTAIKLLPAERAGAATIARFEREVQLTSQLTHPNTVAIYDYGRTPDNVFYYAMEYLEGTDLEHLVTCYGPQPPERVRHWLWQILGALAEAHARGIVHRDVKPGNVFVCERGLIPDFVKVLDFGLARELEGGAQAAGDTGVGQLAGTPLYMSPEQILGAPLDGRSDLYAVGALAYFLLTGTPVFSGQSVVEVCAQHLHTPVLPPSERLGRPLPDALERLVLACLEKDPARRPHDALTLRAVLDACDDVPPWTQDDARRWWAEHAAPPLRSEPLPARTTIDVARGGRVEAP